MTHILRPYGQYKESGNEWLGHVPSHWLVLPHRAVFREVIEKGHEHESLLSVTIGRGVIRQADLISSSAKKDSSNENKATYKLVERGDIVYNKMRAWQGALGYSEYRGIVSPAYIVVRSRNPQSSAFYHHLMRTTAFMTEAERWSYGITSDQWSLRASDFKCIYTVVPPREEQEGIARFVDSIDQRVNRLIRAKRKLIKLLVEQRQAIVRGTLTRSPNADTLVSPDIDWIAEIPDNWKVVRVGTLAAALETGPFGSQLHSHEYIEGGVPIINPSHMKGGRVQSDPRCTIPETKASQLSRHKVAAGDVVFARRGELGRCALITHAEAGWLCGTGSLKMKVRGNLVDPRYLVQLMQLDKPREWLSLRSVGSTMENLNTGILSQLPLPIPPLTEQLEILSRLETDLQTVDESFAVVSREIGLIREYRERIVAEAVTGHIDVRHLELPGVDEVDEADIGAIVDDYVDREVDSESEEETE